MVKSLDGKMYEAQLKSLGLFRKEGTEDLFPQRRMREAV